MARASAERERWSADRAGASRERRAGSRFLGARQGRCGSRGAIPEGVPTPPEDTAEARENGSVRAAPLLAIDAYQTGHAVEARDALGKQHLVFNKSDAANRVQDILTGLKFLSAAGAGKVTLIGYGDAGVWCVFAAAVAESPVDVKADLASFHGEDSDFIQRFFVPSIQRAGGLESRAGISQAVAASLTPR